MFARLMGALFLIGLTFTWAINVSPSRLNLWANGGTVLYPTITIENPSTETTNIQIHINNREISAHGEMYVAPYHESWLILSKFNYELAPHQLLTLPVTINVPMQAGEYRAEINITPLTMTSMFRLVKSIPIFLMIKENALVHLDIVTYNVSVTTENICGSVELKNSGNIHTRPTTAVVLMDNQQHELTFPLVSDLPIYPASTRKLAVCTKNTAPHGDYSAIFRVTYAGIHDTCIAEEHFKLRI